MPGKTRARVGTSMAGLSQYGCVVSCRWRRVQLGEGARGTLQLAEISLVQTRHTAALVKYPG
jgi:hypothetical protein